MSETILGGCRWDTLENKAYWARVVLNSSSKPDEYDIKSYNEFLQEKCKNNTAADIALRNSIRRSGGETSSLPYNKRLLERAPKNDYLAKKIQADYFTNYPYSGRLRNLLIENDRFSLSSVKPKMTNSLQKFLIKIKSFI